ncbi:MAG TPA: trypsin-like peptidase domain-containing protein [Gaiellaceae bacterium]
MKMLTRSDLRILSFVLVGLSAVGVSAALAYARMEAAPIGTGIVVIDTNLGYQDGAAAGSGMVLTSSGTVLTNNHVIAGATTIKVVVPGTGHRYSAQVAGYDRTADVAVLRLKSASNLKTISADTSRPSVGEPVKAVGNAGGTGSLTTARGTVIGLNRAITASDEQGSSEQLTGMIETNAAVQPGDSGGPLLTRAGRVIGMDTAASANSQFAANASDAYAIPIGKALAIAAKVVTGHSSSTIHIGATAFLGIEVENVVAGDGYGYGSPTSGALVAGVVPGGPAANAGLVEGDVITAIAGHTISSPTQISGVILQRKPGQTVKVNYVDQYGNGYTTGVKLGSGPAQ